MSIHTTTAQARKPQRWGDPVTLCDVLRVVGPKLAAEFLQHQYGLRRRHAHLVVGMLAIPGKGG